MTLLSPIFCAQGKSALNGAWHDQGGLYCGALQHWRLTSWLTISPDNHTSGPNTSVFGRLYQYSHALKLQFDENGPAPEAAPDTNCRPTATNNPFLS
jgi:hypothetical protein